MITRKPSLLLYRVVGRCDHRSVDGDGRCRVAANRPVHDEQANRTARQPQPDPPAELAVSHVRTPRGGGLSRIGW